MSQKRPGEDIHEHRTSWGTDLPAANTVFIPVEKETAERVFIADALSARLETIRLSWCTHGHVGGPRILISWLSYALTQHNDKFYSNQPNLTPSCFTRREFYLIDGESDEHVLLLFYHLGRVFDVVSYSEVRAGDAVPGVRGKGAVPNKFDPASNENTSKHVLGFFGLAEQVETAFFALFLIRDYLHRDAHLFLPPSLAHLRSDFAPPKNSAEFGDIDKIAARRRIVLSLLVRSEFAHLVSSSLAQEPVAQRIVSWSFQYEKPPPGGFAKWEADEAIKLHASRARIQAVEQDVIRGEAIKLLGIELNKTKRECERLASNLMAACERIDACLAQTLVIRSEFHVFQSDEMHDALSGRGRIFYALPSTSSPISLQSRPRSITTDSPTHRSLRPLPKQLDGIARLPFKPAAPAKVFRRWLSPRFDDPIKYLDELSSPSDPLETDPSLPHKADGDIDNGATDDRERDGDRDGDGDGDGDDEDEMGCYFDNAPSSKSKIPQSVLSRLAAAGIGLLRNGRMTLPEDAVENLHNLPFPTTFADPKLNANHKARLLLETLLREAKDGEFVWSEGEIELVNLCREERAAEVDAQVKGGANWDGAPVVDIHVGELKEGRAGKNLTAGAKKGIAVISTYPLQQHIAGHRSGLLPASAFFIPDLSRIPAPTRLNHTAYVYQASFEMVPNLVADGLWFDTVCSSRPASSPTDSNDPAQRKVAIASLKILRDGRIQTALLAQSSNRVWLMESLAPTHKVTKTETTRKGNKEIVTTSTEFFWEHFETEKSFAGLKKKYKGMVKLSEKEKEEWFDANVFDVTDLRPFGTPILFVLDLFGGGFPALLGFMPHYCGVNASRTPHDQFLKTVNSIESAKFTFSSFFAVDEATLKQYEKWRAALNPRSPDVTLLNERFNFHPKGVETMDPKSTSILPTLFRIRRQETDSGIAVAPEFMATPLRHALATLTNLSLPPQRTPTNSDPESHIFDAIHEVQRHKLASLARIQRTAPAQRSASDEEILSYVIEAGTWTKMMRGLGMLQREIDGPDCLVIVHGLRNRRQTRLNHTTSHFALQSLTSALAKQSTFPRHLFTAHIDATLSIAEGGNRRAITGFLTTQVGIISVGVTEKTGKGFKGIKSIDEADICGKCRKKGLRCIIPFFEAIPFLVGLYGSKAMIEVLEDYGNAMEKQSTVKSREFYWEELKASAKLYRDESARLREEEEAFLVVIEGSFEDGSYEAKVAALPAKIPAP